MEYTEKQNRAINEAIEWYYLRSYSKNTFVIAGLAGTGKTTIVKRIVELLGLPDHNILYVTLTGKASLNLRLKGNPSNTIHKTFYNIYNNDKGKIRFSLKKMLTVNVKLIILDEFSMVDDKMLNELFSFGVPVILLGDPGQLPPIIGLNRYMKDDKLIDIFLTEIMRQSDTSGILQLADMARKQEKIHYGKYKDSLVTEYSSIRSKITEYDIVLCWSNKTRRWLNTIIREDLGYKSKYPQKGEKILALRNNYNHHIDYEDIPIYVVNGLICNCLEDTIVEDRSLRLKLIPEFIKNNDNEFFEVDSCKSCFDMYYDDTPFVHLPKGLTDSPEDLEFINRLTYMDWGYALTCHKSQGSEWDNVLILDEYRGGYDTYSKWLYTAITRAKKSVTICSL